MESVSSADTSNHVLLSTSVSPSIQQTWPTIAGLLVLIYIWFRSMDYVQRRELPPGPRGWPIIGNILDIGGKWPHRALMQLGEKYGPLFYLKLGSVPTVVINSPAMAEEFLKTQDQIFADRPPTLFGEIFFYNRQDVMTSPLGPKWRELRKMVALELLSQKRLATFIDVRKRLVVETLQRILKEGSEGKLVNISKKTSEITFNNATRMLFSESFHGYQTKSVDSQGKVREFQDLNEEVGRAAGEFSIMDFIPWLRVLDISRWKATLWKLRRDYDDFLTVVLSKRREKDSKNVTATRDVTDVILELQKKGTPIGGTGLIFTEDVVKAFLSVMITGGSDTAAAQMIWMLSEALRHPDVKQKLLEELDNVVGRERLVDEADLDNLPYFQATLRETFRLHPIAPLLLPHYSTQETKVAGYTIPKNSWVFINEFHICRRPEVWENPTKFDPTRFLNDMVDFRGSDYRLSPFSSGLRMCAGMGLATILVSLIVAQILQTCDLSLPKGMKPEDIDFEEVFGAVMHKRVPLEVHVSPRLPHHVYTAAGIDF